MSFNYTLFYIQSIIQCIVSGYNTISNFKIANLILARRPPMRERLGETRKKK